MDRPIDFVEASSEKIYVKFSLLVKEYALTKEAYDYLGKLQFNTETLGGVFDAQPSSLTGNVHNISNTAEPVIGYISAGTIAQKRIFIADIDLPGNYRLAYSLTTPYNDLTCPVGNVSPVDFGTLYSGPNPLYVPTVMPNSATYPICADCTLRGHTAKPAFWQ